MKDVCSRQMWLWKFLFISFDIHAWSVSYQVFVPYWFHEEIQAVLHRSIFTRKMSCIWIWIINTIIPVIIPVAHGIDAGMTVSLYAMYIIRDLRYRDESLSLCAYVITLTADCLLLGMLRHHARTTWLYGRQWEHAPQPTTDLHSSIPQMYQ